jgi:hypothetical protein
MRASSEAGRASARDPAATIGPQRQRLRDRLRAGDRTIDDPERKRLSRQA